MECMTDESFSELRIDYGDQALRRADLPKDPIDLFRNWMDLAAKAGVREPNAMSLATCSADGQPHCRVVLLKQLDSNGFGFFTNKKSAKGSQLGENVRAAATFWWGGPRARQVRIEGVISELPEADADKYFASRPRRAQLCSAASPQSQVVKDRDELEGIVGALEANYTGQAIRRPDHWGGYALKPHLLEFWQGRDGRLHDRFRFELGAGSWLVDRLAP
jgi:pyridoxamine 5'-phosphate oxidase